MAALKMAESEGFPLRVGGDPNVGRSAAIDEFLQIELPKLFRFSLIFCGAQRIKIHINLEESLVRVARFAKIMSLRRVN